MKIEYTKICVICGKEFKTFKSRKMTCSDECRIKKWNSHRGKKQDPTKRAEYDRARWLKTHPNAKTQKEISEEAAIRERERKKKADYWNNYKAEHICFVCGNKYIAKYPTSVYCSDECKKKHNNYKKTIKKSKRYEGITIDSDISLFKLSKRDHNICQICGLAVDWNDYKKTDRATICGDMYPSIDHITPISKGGLHSWGNIQLAHRKCNYIKKDELWMNSKELTIFGAN